MSTSASQQPDYISVLRNLPRYVDQAWVRLNGNRAYFGDPSHTENGIRTAANVVLGLSVLFREDDGNGVSSADSLERIRATLGYLTSGHATGKQSCADGKRWGLCWQSSWWTARMALGAHLVWRELGQPERDAVQRVVVSEADHLLAGLIPSGLMEDTKAEENAWDTEILSVACAMLPGHAHAHRWRDRLNQFAFNTFSVARDQEDETLVEGRTVSQWVESVNLHSDFTLENHGSYHFCYVASPLHSLALSDLAFRLTDQLPPASLQHNVRPVWQLAQATFLTRRFAYVGGQDWARYTYGEYFIISAAAWLRYALGDPAAAHIEQARFDTLADEHLENADGSIFGARFTGGRLRGQHAKYETDAFANLALAHLQHLVWSGSAKAPGAVREPFVPTRHVSHEAGVAFCRGPTMFASFCWKTLTTPHPMALFIPLADDSLAEWQPNNLIGEVVLCEPINQALWIRGMRGNNSGFEAAGRIIYRNRQGAIVLVNHLSYDVDAANGMARVRTRFVAQSRIKVAARYGLSYCVPNDRFNGHHRDIHSAAGTLSVDEMPSAGWRTTSAGRIALKILNRLLPHRGLTTSTHKVVGNWLNVDDRIGIINNLAGSEAWFLVEQPFERNSTWGSLAYLRILSERTPVGRWFEAGSTAFEQDYTIIAGNSDQTRKWADGVDSDRSRTARPQQQHGI